MQLTALGEAFIRSLPVTAKASLDEFDNDRKEIKDPWIEQLSREAFNASMGLAAAIVSAARQDPAVHIADLAAVVRYRDKDAYEREELDREAMKLLANAVLKLAGVDGDATCDEDALCDAEIEKARGEVEKV